MAWAASAARALEPDVGVQRLHAAPAWRRRGADAMQTGVAKPSPAAVSSRKAGNSKGESREFLRREHGIFELFGRLSTTVPGLANGKLGVESPMASESKGPRLPGWPNSCALYCSSAAVCHPRTIMTRLSRKSLLRCVMVLTLLGLLMVLIALTNPSATLMAAATLLIGVLMIAIASFAGL